MSSCWLWWWSVLFVPQFCRSSKNGHDFGLVIDGDEFCVRLGESVDSKLACAHACAHFSRARMTFH